MINRTFSGIRANVGTNIQDTSTPMETIIKKNINNIYFDILKRVDFYILEDDYSLATASQDNVLPDNFGKELAVLDTTNNNELHYEDTQKFIKDNPSLAYSTGTPSNYDIIERGYRTQPTTAGVIDIVSSSASDTTQTITIRGISDSVEITEDVTLTGTSTASTTNSFSKVYGFGKSAVTVGKVTITTGSDVLAIIPPQIVDYKVKILKLFPTPTASITLQIPYNVEPQPMVEDYDVPVIDIADILELGAEALCWKYKRQFEKAKQVKMDYEQLLANYIFSKERNPNRNHFLNITPYSRETV